MRSKETYHTDSLQGEQRGAEIEGEVSQCTEHLPLVDRRQIVKHVH